MNDILVKASDDNDEAKQRKRPTRKTRMLIIIKELCFLLLVTLTAYGTVLLSQPKTRKWAPSAPFFGNTNVDDFYQGDLSQLMHEVNSATYSFVLFYAPWDADSQDLKFEFLDVSEFYANQVYFAAVNCWEPGSECRSRFKDVVERYPQLVAYVGLGRAIEYKGPHRSEHMIKFLHSILHPITRLNSVTDILKLKFLHDALLVGYLDIQGASDFGLKLICDISFSLATRDYMRRVAIAVFTHTKFNSLMNVNTSPAFILYISDKQFEYTGELKRGPLYKWILDTLDELVVYSQSLLQLKQPSVVMFTPINPLSRFNTYYYLLRRVAVVSKTVTVKDTIDKEYLSEVISYGNSMEKALYKELVETESHIRKQCSKAYQASQACTVVQKWDNFTCNAPAKKTFSASQAREHLTTMYMEERCKILQRAPLLPPTLPQIFSGYALNISFGFACLDSDLYSHLAEGLGVNLSLEPDRTALVVIGEEEMAKVSPVTEKGLWSTLRDWARGQKSRAGNVTEEQAPLAELTNSRIFMPELTLSTFTKILRQTDQHSVILYHSRYCGACSRASLALLELTNLLKKCKCIYLARVDGDKVDVPWHFKLHFYPSLLFIPKHRKSESQLFPPNYPWVFKTLSEFIVANLGIEERPEVMVALCARYSIFPESSTEGSECIRDVRIALVKAIECKLKEIRQRKNGKNVILHLSFLKAVYLSLARVTDISKTLNTIKSLSKDYQMGCSVT